jgi:hypothetical protein
MPTPAHRAARKRGVLRHRERARRGGSLRGQAAPNHTNVTFRASKKAHEV